MVTYSTGEVAKFLNEILNSVGTVITLGISSCIAKLLCIVAMHCQAAMHCCYALTSCFAYTFSDTGQNIKQNIISLMLVIFDNATFPSKCLNDSVKGF